MNPLDWFKFLHGLNFNESNDLAFTNGANIFWNKPETHLLEIKRNEYLLFVLIEVQEFICFLQTFKYIFIDYYVNFDSTVIFIINYCKSNDTG